MFLLNLTVAEFLALFGAVSALIFALYLLDRSRRRQTVATLRFWKPAENPVQLRRRRRKIQQPLSLLLQILSLACLLLAIGQLHFGSREGGARDHVLILDTSAWMAARTGNGTLMDEARVLALSWLRALPARDRIMLVRADALATPGTVFESDRRVIEDAVRSSQPGYTALDIKQALEFARRVQKLHGAGAGEIVFVGAGRITKHEADSPVEAPRNLRVLQVSGVIDNCGLRGIGLRHSNSDPSLWEVFVSIRNYGTTPKNVSLGLQFGGSPSGIRNFTLPAAGEQSITFELRTRAAGWLEARLLTTDAFPGDDRATLELPQQELFRVAVFSDHPDWLKPVLEANPNIEAKFYKPVEYSEQAGAAVIILDRFRPASLPSTDSIWIEPPVESSPVRVLTKVRNVTVTRWVSESPIATGLRVQDLRLGSAEVFDLARGDVAVAEIPEGPVIVARPAKPKMVVLGFHPVRSAMRYQLATPLMFANILRWMAPEVFRRWELNSGTVGTVTAAIDAETDPSGVRVLAEDRRVLPFTTDGQNVRFFAGTPATVRVLAGDRERVYSLTLPEVADSTWEPPSWIKRGIPVTAVATASSKDLWQLLALLGGLGLFLDWLLFGQAKSGFRGVNVSTTGLRSFSFRGFVSSILRKAS